MGLRDVIGLLQEYFTQAIIILLGLSMLVALVYWVGYKWLMKGKQSLKMSKLLLGGITALYLLLVLQAVFLGRWHPFDEAIVNVLPLLTYYYAWQRWSMNEWGEIILNILLFVPFGMLLVFWFGRWMKGWHALLISFAFSLVIECSQLITRRGVFDVDDLLNNTIGGFVGYGLGVLLLLLIKRKRVTFKVLLRNLAPLLAIILIFSSIFVGYSMQELGNLRDSYPMYGSVKIAPIHVSSELQLKDAPGSAPIYKANILTADEAKIIAETILAVRDFEIDENNMSFYNNSASFFAKDRQAHISVNYNGGTLSYTDFTISKSETDNVSELEEAVVRDLLFDYRIAVPQLADFEQQTDGSYMFKAHQLIVDGHMINGSLSASISDAGVIERISSKLVLFDNYRMGDIISEAEAYRRLPRSVVELYRFTGENSEIKVQAVALDYEMDTKGYFQPVYLFDCKINISDGLKQWTFKVPALK